MAATQKTVVQITPTTLKRIKEIKKSSGVAIGTLADRGLDFVCSAIKRGEIVIQNGEMVAAGSQAS